jgi:hypothetical protein
LLTSLCGADSGGERWTDAFNDRDVAAMNAVHHRDVIAHVAGSH